MPFSCALFSKMAWGGSSHIVILSHSMFRILFIWAGRITQLAYTHVEMGRLMSSSALRSSGNAHANGSTAKKSLLSFIYSYATCLSHFLHLSRSQPAGRLDDDEPFFASAHTRGERQFALAVVIKSFRRWICLFFSFALGAQRAQQHTELFARRLLGKSKCCWYFCIITQNAPKHTITRIKAALMMFVLRTKKGFLFFAQ